MKKTILHLRRSFGKTFLFFLLLFCVAVFLQTTQFLQKTEKEMMVGIQTILQPRLRIRTPFAYGQFDEEQKIDAERELFLATLATLKDDPRVLTYVMNRFSIMVFYSLLPVSMTMILWLAL